MKTGTQCFQAKTGELTREWFVVDATNQVLGRLAVRIATILMGKHKPTYTPHIDTGDFVVVLNVDKLRVTGGKAREISYASYSRYPSGLKVTPFERMQERHPERILHAAVRRMLPKNALARHMLAKLKIYRGADHPHQAQQPKPLPMSS